MTRAGQLGKRPFLPMGAPSLAVDDGGWIYFTTGEEYQVHKFAPSGEMAWALRTAHARSPYPQETIEANLARALEDRPETARHDYFIPERQPALNSVAVDGHGHLWVFPWVDSLSSLAGETRPDWRPVDAYGPDGTPLFSGFVNGELIDGWQRARGDHVYAAELDLTTNEMVVARYRLEEPFE